MLIIQHIWTKWTKRSRGADAPIKRPRLDDAYMLPPAPGAPGAPGVLRHEIRALESERFELVETAGEISRQEWERQWPHRNNALDWRIRGDEADIILKKPSEHTQQTKWPAHLPSPLFTLDMGETARIEWNGRFISSLSGYNRASYYEQHVYWLAVAEAPEPRLFLDAEPRKTIDLTTGIY